MKLTVVGLGPGAGEDLTGRARRAIEEADLVVGYTAYITLIRDQFPGKEMISTGMKQEADRCRLAVEAAAAGKNVAVVCSGDAGIYGMAGLLYEAAQDYPSIDIEVVPGVTAACGGAAVLGAPLAHDFAVISLSDLLTPGRRSKSGWRPPPRRPSSSASTTPAAGAAPTTCGGPATSCWPGGPRTRCAASCKTSAGRGSGR